MQVLVLACGHCGVSRPDTAVPLGPHASFVWEPSLCGEGLRLPAGAEARDFGLVLLTQSDVERRAFLVDEAMRAGVHPLRVRFLEGWRLFPWRELETHLRAAVDRMQRLGDLFDAPTRETRRFQGELPRRGLLIPFPRYREPVPRIEVNRCRAGHGCDLCVEACPEGAIARAIPPTIDPTKCASCGLCISVCPTHAVRHPSLDVEGFLSEAAILADAPGVNLLVGCRTSLRSLSRGDLPGGPSRWRLLEVPSLGLLRPIDVLRLRTMGFDRVVGLRRGRCCPGPPGPFEVAAALTRGLGMSGTVEAWDLEGGPLPDAWSEPFAGEHRPWPEAGSLQAFAVAMASPERARVALPGPGAGLVRIDAEKCTLCEVCVERCGPQALRVEESAAGSLQITFDAGACDACGLCVRFCPEHAVSLEYGVDTEAVGRRTTLAEDTWVRCRSCGAPVAPRRLFAHVAAQVKIAGALDLCPDCKPLWKPAMGVRR